MKCVIAGLIGGVIGAAVWGAIAHFTGYEIGWIAWAVGALVGICVRVAAAGDSGAGLGAMSAVIALAAIAGGKYMAVYMVVEAEAKKFMAIEFTDDQVKHYIAVQLVKENEKAGTEMKWPKGKSLEDAEEAEDFPPEVWKDMEARWAGMSVPERKDYRAQLQKSIMAEIKGATAGVAGSGLVDNLSPWDALWAILALSSAFRIGSGAMSDGSGDD